ncbi:MAG: hypothetical protein AB7U83_12230 [Vicinamibacterales bacterium]
MHHATPAGLCAACRWRQDVVGARSTFVLCGRAREDPRYPKYPQLPVLSCAGFEPPDPSAPPPGDPPAR